MLGPQRAILALTFLLGLGLLKLLWHGATRRDSQTARQQACDGLHGIEDVLVVLKTGSSEIYEKLPMHLATSFLCLSEYLIYSDLEQQFGSVQVHDALALVSEDVRDQHPDLVQYRSLQQHVKSGGDAAKLKGERSWSLDKWKFLPMISDAYHRFGEQKKWLVFVEADTYLSLHNLLLWLRQLDSSSPVYAGAQVMIGDTEFAHGGSGFVMSSVAAKDFTHTYESSRAHWESDLAEECCGDKVAAEVLLEVSPAVYLHRSFPVIQGQTVASLDWSATHWCKPAVSWHHADAAGVDRLWQFERQWRHSKGAEQPILFADYFAAFVWPHISATNGSIHDWDNLSGDWVFERGKIVTAAYKDAATCEAFCGAHLDCLQWAWSPGLCRAGRTVRLGWALGFRPALGSADDRVTEGGAQGTDGAVSGWMLDRILAFKAGQEPCDEERFWTTHES